jgi:hypothetical protein
MKKMLVAVALLGFVACKSKNQGNTQQPVITESEKVEVVDSPKIQTEKDSLLKLNKTSAEEGPKDK